MGTSVNLSVTIIAAIRGRAVVNTIPELTLGWMVPHARVERIRPDIEEVRVGDVIG